jgi:GNAT superfamily N-acetyltransferase
MPRKPRRVNLRASRGQLMMLRRQAVSVTIRSATPEDLDRLRQLYDEFHSFHVRGVSDYLRNPEPDEVNPDEFAEAVADLIASVDKSLLVAEAEGEIVGLAETYMNALPDSPFVISRRTATLQSLLVTEATRGIGVGGALVEAAERWATERGAEVIRTKVWEFPEGPLPFYERLGYSTIIRELAKDVG